MPLLPGNVYNGGEKRRSPSSDPAVQRERRGGKIREWRERNAEKVRAQGRALFAKNREKCVASIRKHRKANQDYYTAKQREWVAKNPEKAAAQKRATHFKRKYGITIADYDAMREAQGGCCAICGVHKDGYELCVDHNHTTGAVRALLCGGCNNGVGFLGEDRNRMMLAIQYLERHSPEVPVNG